MVLAQPSPHYRPLREVLLEAMGATAGSQVARVPCLSSHVHSHEHDVGNNDGDDQPDDQSDDIYPRLPERIQ